MENRNTHNCPQCQNTVANSADFCGFCGSSQRRLTTPLAALDAVLRKTEMMHTIDDDQTSAVPATVQEAVQDHAPRFTESVSVIGYEHADDEAWDDWDDDLFDRKGKAKRIGAGVVILLCVAAVGIATFFLVQQIEDEGASVDELAAVAVVEEAPVVEEPEPTKKSVGLARATVTVEGKIAKVNIGTQTLITLAAKKGSRYDSLKERGKSVEVRLNHVLDNVRDAKPKGTIFVSRTNGDRSEVAWQNPNGSYFRVVDVTAQDVKAWTKEHKSKTTPHILSNLIADQLNSVVEQSLADRS